MTDYMFFYHPREERGATQEQVMERVQAYRKWAAALGEQHLADQRLEPEGIRLTPDGPLPTDGPLDEAKEWVAGYTRISAANLEEAIRIAYTCPLIEWVTVEVRPVMYYPPLDD